MKEIILTKDIVSHYEKVNSVVALVLKGHNPTDIGKKLGMKRSDVVAYIGQWSEVARDNRQIQERAKDAVTAADAHFSMIIKELWESVEDFKISNDLRGKNAALKSIAEVESQRISVLQKSGLLERQELADQMMDLEEKNQKLVNIIKNVLCESCRQKVIRELSDIADRAVVVVDSNAT